MSPAERSAIDVAVDRTEQRRRGVLGALREVVGSEVHCVIAQPGWCLLRAFVAERLRAELAECEAEGLVESRPRGGGTTVRYYRVTAAGLRRLFAETFARERGGT